ncbi:unnamed protein product [Alopecurus aequalis]
MVKETSARASWNHVLEKGLLDILVEHNVPIYRGQNGWVAEGWRSITSKFNERFPSTQYTKQQIQEKEKDMKANYKAVRDARKMSGTGWNDALHMIIAEPVIWEKLKKNNSRVKKFEGRPFMLFPTLALLYEGSIATGDLHFMSIPSVDLTNDDVSPTNSSTNLGTLNLLSNNLDGGESSTSMNIQGGVERRDEVPAASVGSGQKDDEPVKKRKQSHVALVLEEYMDFRKKQTQVLVEELKEPKDADKYSIANCVAALEPMEELSLAEKSKALRLFKCALNRETFLNIKDPTLRNFWLKEEIADMQKN